MNPIRYEAIKRRNEFIQAKGEACAKCGIKFTYPYAEPVATLHHIKRVEDGGTNDLNNLVLLCRECHSRFHYNPKKIRDAARKHVRKQRRNSQGEFIKESL